MDGGDETGGICDVAGGFCGNRNNSRSNNSNKTFSVQGRDNTQRTHPLDSRQTGEEHRPYGLRRPALYTRAPGAAGIGYTDLKYAYGDGSTFSQEIADVSLEGRPKNVEEAKREYAGAPRALNPEEAAAVAAFDRAKQAAEEARQRRVAARDVDAESAHQKLQRGLMLN